MWLGLFLLGELRMLERRCKSRAFLDFGALSVKYIPMIFNKTPFLALCSV